MTILWLDFETRSRCDLIERGLHPYVRDPSTSVLMLGWAIDENEPQLWFPNRGRPPAELRDAMRDPHVTKMAWNAPFEREVTKHVLKAPYVAPWRDVMVMAYYASLPGQLEMAGKAMRLPQDEQKIADGKKLIRLFCVPHKPSKIHPYEWYDETTHPEEWAKFCDYCLRDVVSERVIYHKLERYKLPEHEWALWELDQEINERGLPVDLDFVRQAQRITLLEKARLAREFYRLTGLKNSATAHLLPWARERGYPFGDLRKENVRRALADFPISDELRTALELRSGLSRTSTAKYDAFTYKASEGRLHYSYQFGGAARTLRWAGRGGQPQNLARTPGFLEDCLEEATQLVIDGEYDELHMRFGNVLAVLTGLVRSSIRAKPGRELVVADLNAIENRGLGYLADCQPTLDVFRKDLCPYKSFGVRLFEVPYEQITKPQRTDSKPAVLGAGYRLGGGELKPNHNGDLVKTGLWGYAENMGIKLTQEASIRAVKIFRESFPKIVQFWYDLEEAAYQAVAYKATTRVGHLVFDYQPGAMRIRLPSGRHLHYLRPEYRMVKFTNKEGEPYTKNVLFYDGMHTTKKIWVRIPTHGGKLAENVTQAFSRDVIAVGLVRAKKAGFPIVGHSHDEIITEPERNSGLTHELLCDLMARPIRWAPGLPLKAAGYTSTFYKKD